MQPVHDLEIADLIVKHFREPLTEQEQVTLQAWIHASEANRRLWEQLQEDGFLREQMDALPNAAATLAAWERLQPQVATPIRRMGYWKYAAAVTGMILCAGLIMYLRQSSSKITHPASLAVTQPQPATIPPGSNKARLLLGNGKVVELKESVEQEIVEEDGTRVKSRSAVLTYHNYTSTASPVYNTLETPRGGEFRVVLPDSSVAWLNASSSLRFPTRFNGSIRNVYLTGEAYFEIAKNKSKPFIVTTNNIAVTVTGTKFNVKAYPDESSISTTLVEGGVQLTETAFAGNKAVQLRPGYQGIWENRQINVQEAYLEEALAWKNGLFVFRSEPLGSIMRKLSRWYDIEVSYASPAVPALRFTGTIRKYESIQKVLEMLELTQKVTFKTDGKNISVTKNTH
jgi:ferric-dicitrate binding protein FerR (iron transport regulator)